MPAPNPTRVEPIAGTDAGRSVPIDLAHLRRYTLGDRPLELEILGLFVDQLALTIGALEKATTDKAWAMAAHTLKGSSRAVGAWSLASLAEQAEALGTGAPDGERRHIVHGLREAAAEARDHIAMLAREG